MRRLSILLSELEDFGLKPELVQAGLPELGSDLAMPCFSLAQTSKQPPQQIAQQLAEQLNHIHIKKAEAVNGYLNLWLSPSFLAHNLDDWQTENENLGQQAKISQRVVVEYFSPNLAKPFSVGHLRNLFQGRALSNLYQARGYEVITDNHIGDWGKTFGIWVVGFLKYGQEEALAQKGSLKELGRIYALITADLKAEADEQKTELEDEIQAWLLKLERGDLQALEYHKYFTQITLAEMQHVLDILDIKFDYILGESFYYQKAKVLLVDLQKQGFIERQADRSLVANLEALGIKIPLLLLKSNGAMLYATSDVATLDYRQKQWQPDQIIYVVGMEQQLYFKQLFAFNELAQLTKAKLVHHAYGLVEERIASGKKRKMSSRTEAVHMEDVLKKATQAAEKLTDKQLTAEDIKTIAQGALVFQEFSQSKKHNTLFDWEKIFSLSDMSGPYVQYATLRLKSILAKAEIEPKFDPHYDWQTEHQLIFKVLGFEDVVENALENLEPYKIALYVYELCRELNRYYETTRILDPNSDHQAARLWLMAVIYQYLGFALSILGIKIPARM